MSLIHEKIKNLKNMHHRFDNINLFVEKNDPLNPRGYNEFPKLILNDSVHKALYTSNNKTIKLVLPLANDENIVLLLTKVENFYSPYYEGTIDLHYSGIVEGNEKSTAILNIFENEITMIVENDYDPIEINKNSNNEYIYHRVSHISYQFTCDTLSSPLSEEESSIRKQIKNRSITYKLEPSTQSLNIYFDSVNTNEVFIKTIFSNVKSVYINDPNVKVDLLYGGISLWTYRLGFIGNLPREIRPRLIFGKYNWTEQLENYISYRLKNQILGVDVYCYSPVDNNIAGSEGRTNLNSLCTSPNLVTVFDTRGNNTNPDFPNYTYNSFVMCHELGHSCGSRHTFDCVWERDENFKQSIGGCANPDDISPYECVPCNSLSIKNETSKCSQPGSNFPEGQTIMSYCFALNNGPPLTFGVQPGLDVRTGVDVYAECKKLVCPILKPQNYSRFFRQNK